MAYFEPRARSAVSPAAILALYLMAGAAVYPAPAQEELPASYRTKFRRDVHGWALQNQTLGGMTGLVKQTLADPEWGGKAKAWTALNGSCDGMVLSALAAYDPKHADAPGLYDTTTKLTVENRQFFAATAQARLAWDSGWSVRNQTTKSPEVMASVLKDMVRTEKPQVLRLHEEGRANNHSVLVTGFERKGNMVLLSVYDPNYRHDPNPARAKDVFIEYDTSKNTFQVNTRDAAGKIEPVYHFNILKHAQEPLLNNVLGKAKDIYRDAADGRFDAKVTKAGAAEVIINKDPTVAGPMIRFDPARGARIGFDVQAALRPRSVPDTFALPPGNVVTSEYGVTRVYRTDDGREPAGKQPAGYPKSVPADYRPQPNELTRAHQGIDITSRDKDGNVKPMDFRAGVHGKVVAPLGGALGTITVELGDGSRIQYLHSSVQKVKIGDTVTPETLLGQTGAREANAVHLHVQARNEKGEYIDPETALRAGSDGSAKGVRIHFNEQVLAEVLEKGSAAENARLVDELERSLAKAGTGSEWAEALAAFETQSNVRFHQRRELRRLDDLAAVSLESLVGRAERHTGNWGQLPDDLRRPGGITRIHGFVISGHDILIVGRREAGALPLEIDDLIVGIRAAWKENATPLVSLDPDPADLEGDPKVRIQGIPQDCGFALTMLEADYAMKKIMAGVEPVDVAGYRTLKQALASTDRTFMSRFWLYPVQPGAGDIQVSSDANSAIFLGGAQVLSEEMALLKEGLVGTGHTFMPAEEAARSFTTHYEAIAARKPVFRRLQALFDVVLLARIWRVRDLKSPLLDRLCALPHRAVEIPRTYRAVRVEVRRDKDVVYYLHGGAQAKIGAGRRSWLALQDDSLETLTREGTRVAASGDVSGRLVTLSVQAAAPSPRRDTSSLDFTTAVTSLFRSDLKGALAAAERLVDSDPWDGEALLLRALIQLRRSDYARARRDADRARALDSDNRGTASAAAEILFQCHWMEGNPDAALREMEAGLKHDPQSANAHVARAEALSLLDKPEEARQALMKAVELDPACALACARLAILELGEGRTLAAKPWIQKAQGLAPNLPEVKIAAASWELATIRPDLAEKIAREVWEKEASGPTVRLQALVILASVSASREKWDDVDKHIGQMGQLSAGSPEVLVVAAEIAITWGEPERARRYLDKAEKLAPKHPLIVKARAKLGK